MNGTFDPTYSSNQIWMDTNLNECLTTHLEGIEGDVSSLQSNKADVNHTHSYNSLTDKPTELPANGGNADTVDGKHSSDFAAVEHGKHVPDTCTLITDWNDAVTTGWYMGDNANNAPSNGQWHWYFGHVIAHNENYLIQEVYRFTDSKEVAEVPKFARMRHNGQWGSWTNITVSMSVPANATLVHADSVIDEGTYGNLTYRKWKNGTSEAWYSEHLGTLSLNTGMAGNVWSSASCNGRVVNFPSGLFISKPIAVGNVYSDGYTCCQVAVADTTRMIYRIWSSYSITISGTEMLIHVVGKWK